jgi:hypothetical protein
MGDASSQLNEELKWLRGEPGSDKPASSMLDPRLHPQEGWTEIVERVETVVKNPELSSFLTILQDHNSRKPDTPASRSPVRKRRELFWRSRRSTCRRRRSPFLLSPYLFHIIHSVEARCETSAQWPALDRPPAKIRAHFQEASAKAKALASLLRKGPQPTVRLARSTQSKRPLPFLVFAPLERQDDLPPTIPLDRLLDDAATACGLMADNIERAKQHRRPGEKASVAKQIELRSHAAIVLTERFREQLGQYFYSHVATIVGLLSGIETDEEYVKKVKQRGGRGHGWGDSFARNS